jgi:hypothetical protein
MSKPEDFKKYLQELDQKRNAERNQWTSNGNSRTSFRSKNDERLYRKWGMDYLRLFVDLEKRYRDDPDHFPKAWIPLLDRRIFGKALKEGTLDDILDYPNVVTINTTEDLDKLLFGRRTQKGSRRKHSGRRRSTKKTRKSRRRSARKSRRFGSMKENLRYLLRGSPKLRNRKVNEQHLLKFDKEAYQKLLRSAYKPHTDIDYAKAYNSNFWNRKI